MSGLAPGFSVRETMEDKSDRKSKYPVNNKVCVASES